MLKSICNWEHLWNCARYGLIALERRLIFIEKTFFCAQGRVQGLVHSRHAFYHWAWPPFLGGSFKKFLPGLVEWCK
jgi:hypothetical protein